MGYGETVPGLADLPFSVTFLVEDEIEWTITGTPPAGVVVWEVQASIVEAPLSAFDGEVSAILPQSWDTSGVTGYQGGNHVTASAFGKDALGHVIAQRLGLVTLIAF